MNFKITKFKNKKFEKINNVILNQFINFLYPLNNYEKERYEINFKIELKEIQIKKDKQEVNLNTYLDDDVSIFTKENKIVAVINDYFYVLYNLNKQNIESIKIFVLEDVR
jgi:hypothetical protein